MAAERFGYVRLIKLLPGFRWPRAVAEMLVVIVGILIALAADDWYAGLQARSQEVALVRGLRDDLLNDQAILQEQLTFLDESGAVIQRLIESIDHPEVPVSDTTAYLRLLKRATITYFFRPTATTYTELTASGSASSITNRQLMRAVIDYHQSGLLTSDLNDIARQIKWFDYNEALAQVIEPTVMAAMTEDWFREANQWPADPGPGAPLERIGPLDLSRLRTSQSFRTALARSLDATVMQRGDVYSTLSECERVLAMAETELLSIS